MKDRLNPLIIIVVIAFCTLVGWYLVINPSNDTMNNIEKEQSSKKEKIDTNIEYPEWMNYILDSDIKSIVLLKTEIEQEEVSVELTEDELKEIFAHLLSDNDVITKLYSDGIGFTGGTILTVTFEKDDKTYKFEIMNGLIFCYDETSSRRDNQEFFELIDKVDSNVVDETFTGIDEYSEYVYRYDNINILGNYFNKN